MLAVIVCTLVLALTYPIRAYVGQRANIRTLEQKRADAQRRVDALEDERAQWEDPGYVESQARQRLRYVRPGEKSLVIIGPAPAVAAPASAAPVAPRVAAPDDPWYQRLWSTVDVAGQPAAAKMAPRKNAPATPAP